MTEGLLSIALAAAHLEAEMKRSHQDPRVPSTATNMPKKSLEPAAEQPPRLPESLKITVDTPRQVSNNTVETSSDEDPISDPEETLAQILADQPKETPPPPAQNEVIAAVQPDDVLCGRGGETNHHPGNVQYRGLVKKYQRLYLKAKRRDKPKIARLIVDTVRRRSGRFLKKDPVAGVWKDVGNNKAREKTSQALREGAPEIRDHDNKRKVPPAPIPNGVGVLMHPHHPPMRFPHHHHHLAPPHPSMTHPTPVPPCGQVVSPNSSTSSLQPVDEQVIRSAATSSFPAYEIVPAKKMKLNNTASAITRPIPNTNLSTMANVHSMSSGGSSGPRLKFLKSRLNSAKGNPCAVTGTEAV
mmetsp:Transcript_4185/g.6010  ORF Transcript_4185/g.6010 Transcript_4185/m.6010 type:complete len:356 (+) Transcript_4185:103-1170(+)|eukprot:CAMPEP_0194211206 /NCGR_PEP_ID=MMETSP0156-20130528/9792_1 /TAXON_ID=33649 /ORGANISM="Thalassionema nitzschioides, Strain L26-B" /LENGTH=355 /DNA_ID=CAMNT_0038938701 /DNA_START=44 /DNA_END=1111 /DNA_ORIENTATION=+